MYLMRLVSRKSLQPGRNSTRPAIRPCIERLNAMRRRGQLPLTLRGRRFTYRGLRTIIRCVAEHYREGRTRISEVVCAKLGWRQPNGWPKDRACRDVLRLLETMHILTLPPRLVRNVQAQFPKRPTRQPLLPKPDAPMQTMPTAIELELAKGNTAEKVWNTLINTHHYLGHRVQVGRCLKYLIRGDGQLIGAISFSSPAWKVAIRDKVLSEIGITGRDIRDVVINNSRFCILPHIRVPHLASRVLALSTRQIVSDWTTYYSIKPLIAETFVETARFEGTCYRAANWNHIGITNGFAKLGASHHNSQQAKMIFVYGLTRSYRRRLAVTVPTINAVTYAND